MMGFLAPGLQNLLAERDRWALWLPVAMGSGVALYFALPVEPPPIPCIAALVLVAAALTLLRRRAVLRVVLLGLGVALLGFAAAELRTAMVEAPMLSANLANVRIEGRVREIELLPTGRRVQLDEVVIQWRPNPPAALRLRLVGVEPPLVPGDRIRVEVAGE